MLIECGVKPESLPIAEDLSKVKRRLEIDEKSILKKVKLKTKIKNSDG